MKHVTFHKTFGMIVLMLLMVFSTQASAQRAPKEITGDWRVKVEYDERQRESILSFSKDKEGKRVGQSISFWGITELKEVKFEDNKLSFVQVNRSRDGGEYTSNFTGTVKGRKLSGTLSSDRGDSKVAGNRIKQMSRAIGNWKMKLKVGEREFTATLAVKADKEGQLTADWQSDWGEHEITEMKFKKGKLTFKRKSKVQDREWESAFEGTVKGNSLSGTIKSSRGDVVIEGKRIGAALVGKWNLEIESEQGNRKQRLQVNPDLSGMYGSAPVEKISFKKGNVEFTLVLKFGDRQFEMSFKGKLAKGKLSGELTSSRGSRKVTGKKMNRKSRKNQTKTVI